MRMTIITYHHLIHHISVPDRHTYLKTVTQSHRAITHSTSTLFTHDQESSTIESSGMRNTDRRKTNDDVAKEYTLKGNFDQQNPEITTHYRNLGLAEFSFGD
jgi:hypothetical protein